MPNSSFDSTPVRDAGPSRRQFFHKAGLAAGGLYALAGPSILRPWVSGAEAATDKRSYIGGRFGLELDNTYCGTLNQFEGGNFTADIIAHATGSERVKSKTLGAPKIEAITVETGLEMAKPWYDWISRTMNGEPLRKSGAVIELDQNSKEIGRRIFTNALLSEIEFPASDATNAKDPWKLTVSFVPEQLQVVSGPGKQFPSGTKTKTGFASNYRLNIQGLETATQRATKIDAFAIKQQIVVGGLGGTKSSALTPGFLEFPNLEVSVPEAFAGPLYGWIDDFVVKGNNGTTKERPGLLEYLAPDGKPFASVQLIGLGVFKISTEGGPPNVERQRRTKVDMYCQRMTATFNP
jgi:tail tube protein gp19